MILAVLEPVSVALKFGFLIVLYLFLLWVARSALKDLRRDPGAAGPAPVPSDATGMYAASQGLGRSDGPAAGRVRVENVAGPNAGERDQGAGRRTLGRGTVAQ